MISSTGICAAGAATGEPCDNSVGPLCIPWAQCVRGFCKVADFGVCK
jgi:hypothetical protein